MTKRNLAIISLFAVSCWSLLFAILAIPGCAFAQDTVTLPPPVTPAQLSALPPWAVTLVTLIMTLGPILAWVFRMIAPLIRTHTKKGEAGYAFLVAGELAASVVAEVEVRLKPLWVKAREDGTITPEEASKLKEEAFKMFMELAPIHLKKALGEMFGDESAVRTYVGGLLERANAASEVTGAVP